MKLVLKRQPSVNGSTLGRLSIDGQDVCFTMEDQIRDGQPKVYGETAIPAGKYDVIVTMSNRFKRMLPLVQNVPGFEGIRIHPGNTKEDTEGCILPGVTHSADKSTVFSSRIAFSVVYNAINTALNKGEKVTLEIINP